MDEKCETCKFWKSAVLKKTKGFCRRYPPIHRADTSSDVFPYTKFHEWCGEYIVADK